MNTYDEDSRLVTVPIAVASGDGTDYVEAILAAASVDVPRRPHIVAGFIKSDAATNITIEDTDGTDLSGPIPFGAGDGGPISARLVGTYGKGLQVRTSAAANIGGWITYRLGF